MTAYLLERAWVDGDVHEDVLVEIADGRFVEVAPLRGSTTATRVPGLTVPGLANAHSHAFHRALRGRTHGDRETFWSWREAMYAVARGLDPDTAYALAFACYREMAAAGITTVGEFHYLHSGPDGTPYADPNAMGHAHIAAARDAGIRIVLLDTCYLASGIGSPPEGVQVRFADGDASSWAERVSALASGVEAAGDDGVAVGAAVHSVRAVPQDQLRTVVEWASGSGRSLTRPEAPLDGPGGATRRAGRRISTDWDRDRDKDRDRDPDREATATRPGVLHVHLSEQPEENRACLAAYGATPTAVLEEAGVWGPGTTAVHATHLSEHDIQILGDSRTTVCLCPTTERELADGIGPARALADEGCPLTLGTDSQAVIDLCEEMRALEMHERLASGRRGNWTAADLLTAGTTDGHASLGFSDAGRIAVGQRADLVTVDLVSPRTAGTGGDLATLVFAATSEDVRQVVVDGRVVVGPGDRAEIGRLLDRTLRDVVAALG